MENVFTLYFNRLNNTGIHYAITGQTEKYPRVIKGDIDIVIPKRQVDNFWSFMNNLKEKHIKWIQVISHEYSGHLCVVTISNGLSNQMIKPDVCSDYYRRGTLLLKANYLLINRVFNPRGFFQLAPDKEFIYYLLKKIDKGLINETQFIHLYQQWQLDKLGCEESLKSFFTIKHQKIIKKSFDFEEFSLLNQELKTLKKGLHQKLKFKIGDFTRRIVNRILRIIRPTGLVIAFLGPDGAGKTTVIDGVKGNLREAFFQINQFHLFPKKGKNGPPTINPHGSKPRGVVGSLFKLIYFLGLYVFGYWGKIFPLKVRSTIVIFDRYYHDILIDPIRYRHGGGLLMSKLIELLIPKPDLWILLDAPASVIQKRKSEVTMEETERQLISYHQLFRKLKNAYIINANQTAEKVILDTENVVFNFLQERTHTRYNKY